MDKTEIQPIQIQPTTSEKEFVKVTISLKEAALLRSLRSYNYGKFIITKQSGQLVRVEIQDSNVLKESDGIAFAIENKKFEAELGRKESKIVNGG